MYTIPNSLSEDMGVPSNSIYNFLNRLDQFQIPMHSVLLARHGKLITEAYYSPYDAKTLHRMFSVSKSFTSIAIGLLIAEGKLSLEDSIIQYFPDKLPLQVHPWIAQLTIREMLKMQTCHSSTTYKTHPDKDWVESFFIAKPSHPPGTVFHYDSSSSHTLCALVERLTGKPMLDYLRGCYLDQVGFSKDAYMLQDPFGISMGASGLMATPMDLMIFALIIMKGGSLEERHFLPKEYLQEATSHQTDTLVKGPVLEECQGYGYQFWRIQNDGFACYGMGGQLAICLPRYDLICVTTADTQGIQGGNQLIYQSLYDELLPFLSNEALPADPTSQTLLENYIKKLFIKPLVSYVSSPLMSVIDKQCYQLSENLSGFTSLSLEFLPENKTGLLILTKDNINHNLAFGFGKMVTSQFPIYFQRCLTSGTWLSEDTLYIKSHLIDECIGSIYFQLVFQKNTVTIYMKNIEESYFNEFTGYLYGQCL